MFCHKCGNKIAEGSAFCHKCGTKVVLENALPQNSSISVSPQQQPYIAPPPVAPAPAFYQNTPAPAGVATNIFGNKKNLIIIGAIIAVIIIGIIIAVAVSSHNDDTYSPDSISTNTSRQQTSGGRIVIGETQTYDDEWLTGIVEVTLDYAEFANRAPNPWGELIDEPWDYPEPGYIYLRVEYTVKNIGTSSSSFIPSMGKLIYDGIYEFDSSVSDPILALNQDALSPAEKATVYYLIPDKAVESDISLVLVFGDATVNEAGMSFVIRPGATGGRSGTDTSGERDSTSNEYPGEIVYNRPLAKPTVSFQNCKYRQ